MRRQCATSSGSGFQPPQTPLDAVPAFSRALSSSTRSTRRKRGVAGRRSETNSGAGAFAHPARAAGPAITNYHVVSVRCTNSASKVFSTGPKFAILLFLEHKSKKQGYGRNPRLLPARQRTVATRASRRRAAWREIVFAASHQRRSGLLGHVVSGDARDEVREDGRGPSGRRGRPENLVAIHLKTLIPRPGSRPFRGAIRAVGSGWSDTSAPGRLTSRPEKTAAGRPGGALARRISRNPLKTLIPRPGFRPFRGAIRAVGSGCSDASSPARLDDEAREDRRGPPGRRPRPGNLSQSLENIDSAPGLSTLPRSYPGGRVRLVRHIGAGEAHVEAGKDGRGPPGWRDRPGNLAQSLENIDFRARDRDLSEELPGRSGQTGPTHRRRRRSRRGPRRRPRAAPGGAIARRISRNPLKTLNSAPGIATPPRLSPRRRRRLLLAPQT